MYWKDREATATASARKWVSLKGQEISDWEHRVVAGLDELRKQRPIEALCKDNGELKECLVSPKKKPYQLTDVRWTELSFYEVAHGTAPVLVELRYEDPSESQKEDPSSEYWPTHRACSYYIVHKLDQKIEIVHLNGTSPPIHEFNAKMGRDGKGSIDLRMARDYCEFFCTFVAGGNEHERIPFIVLSSGDDLQWCPASNAAAPASEFRHRLEADLGGTPKPRYTIDEAKENFNKKIAIIAGEDKGTCDAQPPGDQQATEKNGGKALVVTIFFQQATFRAKMKVEDTGMITMDSDEPLLSQYFPLPVDQWQFQPLASQGSDAALVLKPFAEVFGDLRRRKRPVIPNYTLGDFESIVRKDSSLTEAWLQEPIDYKVGPGFVAEENIEYYLRGVEFARAVEVSDVAFFHDVVIDDLRASKSLVFRRCQFFGRLSARNARIGSSLVFRDCKFYGMPAAGGNQQTSNSAANKERVGDLQTVVDLDGIRIDGDLVFERVEAYGHVTIRSAVIGGRGLFRGITLMPLHEGVLPSDEASSSSGERQPETTKLKLSRRWLAQQARRSHGTNLDLRHTSFGPGLELSSWFRPGNPEARYSVGENRQAVPCFVIGGVRADETRIGGSLVLCGLVTADLNKSLFVDGTPVRGWRGATFENSMIEGNVQMWSPGEQPGEGFRVVKTVLMGGLSLARAHVKGQVDLRGIYIHGKVDLALTTCDGHIWLGALDTYQIETYADSFLDCELPSRSAGDGRSILSLPEYLLVSQGEKKPKRVTRYGQTRVLTALDLTGAQIFGDVDLRGAFIRDQVLFAGGRYGSINCGPAIGSRSAIIDREFRYSSEKGGPWGDWTKQSVDPRTADWEHGSHEDLENTRLRSDIVRLQVVDEDEARQGGWYEIRRTYECAIYILRFEAARLVIRDSVVDGTVQFAGAWLVKPDDIDAGKDISGSTVRAHRHPAMVKIGTSHSIELEARDRPRLEIENSDINGNLLFFDRRAYENYSRRFHSSEGLEFEWGVAVRRHIVESENQKGVDDKTLDVEKKQPIQRWHIEQYLRHVIPMDWLRLRCSSDIDIKNTRIDGQFDLSGAHVLGRVRLIDVNLTSDLLANNYPLDKAQRDANIKLDFHASKTAASAPTLTSQLDLEMLRCDGDVRIESLRTFELTDKQGQSSDKALSVRNVTVKGRMHLARRVRYVENGKLIEKGPWRSASIHGESDFTGSEIAELILAGCQSEVSLERARFGLLNVRETEEETGKYPSIDFRGTRFDRITVGPDNNDGAIGLKKMLGSSSSSLGAIDASRSEPATRVEQILRAHGRRDEARQMYVFAQDAAAQQLTSPFYKWFVCRLWGPYAGHGTRASTIAWFCFALFLATWVLVTGPSAHWKSEGDGARTLPPPSFLTRMLKAAEITVPMFSLIGDEEDKKRGLLRNWPSKSGEGAWTVPLLDYGSERQPMFMTSLTDGPADMAHFMRTLGWILWPLFLLVLSGFMKREH